MLKLTGFVGGRRLGQGERSVYRAVDKDVIGVGATVKVFDDATMGFVEGIGQAHDPAEDEHMAPFARVKLGQMSVIHAGHGTAVIAGDAADQQALLVGQGKL